MAFGRARGASPPPPSPPNLDNLLPAEADQAERAYRTAVQQWKDARLAAVRAEAGPEPVVPPRPVPPRRTGMTEDQWKAAWYAYRQKFADWLPLERKRLAFESDLRRKAGLLPDPAAFKRDEASDIELPPDYSWREVAQKCALSEASIALLARDGIAVAGPYFKQSFQVYNESPVPPFVTSDAVLNGFHVLLEDSMRRFETVRARLLRADLEAAWGELEPALKKYQVNPGVVEPYRRHLARVLGPALRLLGSTVPLGSPAVEAEVDAEVKRIEAADTVALPDWLGPPDRSLEAIDYRRFRPIGFYAGNPVLSNYYRATRWLQLVPLRASRDVEAGAVALMGSLLYEEANATAGSYSQAPLSAFIAQSAAVFGASDEARIAEGYIGSPRSSVTLPDIFTAVADGRPAGAMIAQVRAAIIDASKYGGSHVVNDELRPWPSSPNDLSNATVRILPPATLPDAIWFEQVDRWRGRSMLPSGMEVAAWLGSPFALEAEIQLEGGGFAQLVAQTARSWGSEQTDPSAPFLYYRALTALFEKPDPAAPAFMGTEAWQRKSIQSALAGWAQFRHTWELQAKMNEIYFGISLHPAGFVEPNEEFFQRLGDAIDFLEDKLSEAGVFAEPVAADLSTPSDPLPPGQALRQRWEDLARLDRALQVLVEKELRGADWNRDDAAVLKYFGETLGGIMGYEGNSYDDPRDDAPRWTVVAHDAAIDRNLAVAVGRPRALYVLYPWKGTQVLCRGAVMSYYEYPSKSRLTDAEWLGELGRKPPPAQPDWIQPLLPAPR